MFGVSREQANLLTFVLALNAANATHDVLQRILRHPWPLSGGDTGIAVFLVREAGFGIAGQKAREVRLFGALIAVAAIGGVTRLGIRRALHSFHVAEQRFVSMKEGWVVNGAGCSGVRVLVGVVGGERRSSLYCLLGGRTRRHWRPAPGAHVQRGPSGGQTKRGASRSGRG
jgi:hypothetical protein